MKVNLILIIIVLSICNSYASSIKFNRDIRPILSDKCFSCHGPGGKPKADLRLDVREEAISNKRKNGAAIVPGSSEKGSFIDRILEKDPDEIMPPPESHKTLSEGEIAILKRWIDEGAKYEKHWAYKKIEKQNLPELIVPKWSTEIDRFVKEKLNKNKLESKPQAKLRVLLRRMSLDIIGLPPRLEDVEGVLEKPTEQNIENYIDRLLTSVFYGEHMAKYWLDVVRYGDTHGIHGDNYREMYAYRDWVIKAFNANMPFATFTKQQLAGDLLKNPTQDQLIASGFNRLHLSNSAGSALKEELFVNNVNDRVQAIGTVFLGLTLECAACHDHKYDPISQKEYYQLFAFFNSMDGPPDNKGKKNPKPFIYIDSKKEQTTLIMREAMKAKPAYILNRGEYNNIGARVYRDTPKFLPEMKQSLPKNRLGFAEWLVDKNHPLFARVTVNRIWQQFFGVGLVKTSEDFGSQGEWPSHPELLDYLAYKFMDSGWNIKALVKEIVMSETYRQSSNSSRQSYLDDPENRQLSRGPRFRLDSEVLRDQALYLSGLLNEKRYGPSVKVPQPKGLWDSVALRGSNTRFFEAAKGEDVYRRSLYSFWKRAYPPPAMTILNAPTRETCVARRERTNTPLQSLVLMNEEQFFASAIALAKLTMKKHANDEERICWAYEKVTLNKLNGKRKGFLIDMLENLQKHYQGDALKAYTMLMNSLLNLEIVKSKN